MRKKAQSTIEVAALIVILVAALLAVQIYIKRGFQGKYRELADNVGEQYDPLKTTSTRITTVETTSVSKSNRLGSVVYGEFGSIYIGPLEIVSGVPTYALQPSESEQSYSTTNSISEDYHVEALE